jgi:hypothetical protein
MKNEKETMPHFPFCIPPRQGEHRGAPGESSRAINLLGL